MHDHPEGKTMKKIFLAAAALLLASAAQATDVGVSVQVGQPGFYGRIDIGNVAPPPVVLAQPVWVERRPVHVAPVYMRVPPGHQKNWAKHCARYNACGTPVYFVREEWYQERYAGHSHGGKDHGKKGHDKGHDKEHGKGHGKGKGND
jgi:opacity protein-like surface antigen